MAWCGWSRTWPRWYSGRGKGILLLSGPKIPACVMEVGLLRRISDGMGGLGGKAHKHSY